MTSLKHYIRFSLIASCLTIVLQAYSQKTFIRAARVIDPASGTVLLNQVLVVENKKIVDIGASISIPANGQVIDLGKATVMPGLFDAHTHVCSTVSKFADWL